MAVWTRLPRSERLLPEFQCFRISIQQKNLRIKICVWRLLPSWGLFLEFVVVFFISKLPVRISLILPVLSEVTGKYRQGAFVCLEHKSLFSPEEALSAIRPDEVDLHGHNRRS